MLSGTESRQDRSYPHLLSQGLFDSPGGLIIHRYTPFIWCASPHLLGGLQPYHSAMDLPTDAVMTDVPATTCSVERAVPFSTAPTPSDFAKPVSSVVAASLSDEFRTRKCVSPTFS